MYYLQVIVRPGGLVVLDDYWWPGVATAARYSQSGLAAACVCELHAGTTACAAIARSAGGAGIQGDDAVLARSMMTGERLSDRR
jgi:hypothetical protein